MIRHFAVIAFGCSLVAAEVPAQKPDGLRIPAFTAYFAPDADAIDVRRDRDVAPFVTPSARLSWYVALTHTGSLRVRVALTVPRGETLTVTLSVASESARRPSNGAPSNSATVSGSPVSSAPSRSAASRHEERITRTLVGSGAEQRLDFAAVAIREPGYSRFTLSASGRADVSTRVSALLLDGPLAADAHFNTDARRNAASVHLRYPVDSTASIIGFYNEVIAVEDPRDTYYMATGFARGYFGMQVNSATERRVIFSVWDAGNGTNANDRRTVAASDQVQLLAKGEGVVAEVFGNEGTGGHSHLVVPWRTGEVQRFFVTAELDSVTTSVAPATIYTGYWFDNDLTRWRLIASFRAPRDGQALRRLYSFSEDFGGSRGDSVRKARFGPAWVQLASGEWRELTTATFSHDPTGREQRLDRSMGVEDGRFFLQHGGFVSSFTAFGAAFTRPASGAPPSIELPARQRAP